MPASVGDPGALLRWRPMSTHDVRETDSSHPSGGSSRSDSDRSGAVEPARVATKRSGLRLPETDAALRRLERAEETEDLDEGFASKASASRDAVYKRLLAAADLIAATAAFTITIPILGHDSLGLWTVAAILMVVPVCKLAGLYDRDEHIVHKTTLDEAPALFMVASLYTLLAFLAGKAIVDGDFGASRPPFSGACCSS